MPRRFYKPYRRSCGSNKKKWASFMKELTPANVTIQPGTVGGGFATCVSNSTQEATPTPTIIKVKYCKLAFDFSSSVLFNQGFVCLMFVPQGIAPTINTPIQHPEWVMAWRGIEIDASGSAKGVQVMLSSRLSRNLNSGDSIIMLWSGYNSGEGAIGCTNYSRFSCVLRNN